MHLSCIVQLVHRSICQKFIVLSYGILLFLSCQVDSIPAVFGVTRDPFIVFSSNLFAILGTFLSCAPLLVFYMDFDN